jgi:hypothetical protein
VPLVSHQISWRYCEPRTFRNEEERVPVSGDHVADIQLVRCEGGDLIMCTPEVTNKAANEFEIGKSMQSAYLDLW